MHLHGQGASSVRYAPPLFLSPLEGRPQYTPPECKVSRTEPHLDNRASNGFAVVMAGRGERRHLRPDNQPPPRASLSGWASDKVALCKAGLQRGLGCLK